LKAAIGRERRLPELLEDVALLLLVVCLIPLGILAIGTPIALFLRLVLEMVRRF
jgi:hypothetical protein